jgi:excisionase family DNA binding protein
MEKQYFTVEEVAKRFQVTEQFIRAEIRRKRLHANLIGREYRISQRDVKDYEDLTHTGDKSKDNLIEIGA